MMQLPAMSFGNEPLETVEPKSWSALRILGAREVNSRTAENLRVRLFPAILSLLAVEPSSTLHITYVSDENGSIAGTFTIEAYDHHVSRDLASALKRVLEPILETVIRDGTEPSAAPGALRWCLARAQQEVSLGFSTAPRSRPLPIMTEGFPYATMTDLLETLTHLPGAAIRIGIAAEPGDQPGPIPSFVLSVSAEVSDPRGIISEHGSDHLPVALRAVLNRMIPGHVVQDAPATMVLGFADAAGLPVLPVTLGDTLPGLDTAPAAAIPVRHLPGQQQPPDGLPLGTSPAASGRPLRVALSDAERVRHIHVTGRTGTGKSTFLANMAYAIAGKGEGLVVLDPHGTLVTRIASELPEEALERTYLIRAGNLGHPVPLNPLATDDPVARDLVIADILASFQTLFDPGQTGIVGPRFEQAVGMCLRTLVAYRGSRASILDVPRVLTDRLFQQEARNMLTDPTVKAFWANNDRATQSPEHAELISWITSKWERFTTTAALRGILASGQDALDLVSAMDENKILLFDLSKGEIGDSAAQLLGFLYSTRIWAAAMKRKGVAPFTMMVDEAHSFMAGALPSMLDEGRKFGLSVVMAHQHLGQLPVALSQALVGNTATHVAFRAGHTDAEALVRRMGNFQPTESYTTLPDLSAVIQRTAGPTTAHPHTLTVTHRFEGQVPQAEDRLRALEEQTALRLSPPSKTPSAPKEPTLEIPARRPGAGDSFLDEWIKKREALSSGPPGPEDPVHEPPDNR